MKVTIRATPGTESRDLKRLVESLAVDPRQHALNAFTVIHPHNCAILKLMDIRVEEDLLAQYVLTAATAHLFALSVGEEHRGWLFMLPQSGNVFSVPSGIIYTRSDLMRLKRDFNKRITVVEGDIQALDPDVYLPHSDFSVCGLENGAVLFVSRNGTHVVTQ